MRVLEGVDGFETMKEYKSGNDCKGETGKAPKDAQSICWNLVEKPLRWVKDERVLVACHCASDLALLYTRSLARASLAVRLSAFCLPSLMRSSNALTCRCDD